MKGATHQKNWTVMVYLAGDNSLDAAGGVDLKEMKRVGSTANINVVAQFDSKSVGTRRYVLKKGGSLDRDCVADLGQTNTGDPQVLEDFIKWANNKFPAEHYLLVVWNHGAGWDDTNIYRAARRVYQLDVTRKGTVVGRALGGALGRVPSSTMRLMSDGRFKRALFSTTVMQGMNSRAIAFDDNAKDFLDNLEMKRLLGHATKAIGHKIDILGLDACLMSMAEVGYQLRDSVMYVVGSEETEPNEGWPYDLILGELVKTPSATPADLSKVIVKKYLASYKPSQPVTQSAFDLGRSSDLATAVDRLALVLIESLTDASVRTAAMQARTQVQHYRCPEYIDLVDFVSLLQGQVNLPALQDACQTVLDNAKVARFVVASGYKGQSLEHSHGVSIYFPAMPVSLTAPISPLYAGLDWTKDTAWGKFLRCYLDVTTRRPN